MDEKLRGLIVYGTSFGATMGTSEEIARILRGENFVIKSINAREEKIKDVTDYNLVIVGSGLANCRWNSQAEDFLNKFHKELGHKELALFVSSIMPLAEREGNTEEIAKIKKAALDDKISKYGLKPIMTGLFGGVLDFGKMGFLTRKAMETAFKSRLQNDGFKETSPGVYDLRDWEKIRSWTKELAKKAEDSMLLLESAQIRG
jgi:menaquinone-dependent protoporphyrinogen IX oxidase